MVRLIRVIAPDAATGLEFRARVGAGRPEGPIFQLAGIRRGGDIDVHRALGLDDEWMHGMVAAQRQSGDDGVGKATRHDGAGGQ